jgi:hypothetical protein
VGLTPAELRFAGESTVGSVSRVDIACMRLAIAMCEKDLEIKDTNEKMK